MVTQREPAVPLTARLRVALLLMPARNTFRLGRPEARGSQKDGLPSCCWVFKSRFKAINRAP